MKIVLYQTIYFKNLKEYLLIKAWGPDGPDLFLDYLSIKNQNDL